MEERRQRDGENRARQQQQQELAADDDGGGGGGAEGTASESSTYYVHSPHGGSPQEVGTTLYNPASPVGESSSTEPIAAHAQAKRFHLQQTSGTFFQHEERGGHDRRRQQPRKRQRQKEQQTPDDGDTIAAPTTRLSRHFSIDETKAYWLNVKQMVLSSSPSQLSAISLAISSPPMMLSVCVVGLLRPSDEFILKTLPSYAPIRTMCSLAYWIRL